MLFLISPLLLPVVVLLGGSIYLRHSPRPLPAGTAYSPLKEGTKRALSLRYRGVAGYELSDGVTVVLIDPVVTRPTLLGLFAGPLRPDDELSKRTFPRADYILIKHAHYDHVVDAPAIALRTGATVVGSRSAVNLALSRGVPPEKTIEAKPGDRLTLGSFQVEVEAYKHSLILGMDDVMIGTIPADAGKLWWWQYTQDGSLSYRLGSNGASIWFAGPSTFEKGTPRPAGTLVMGAAGHHYDTARLSGIFARARPERYFPSHYDNFFQPLSKGMGRLPVMNIDHIRAMAAEAAPTLPFYMLGHGERIDLPPDSPSRKAS